MFWRINNNRKGNKTIIYESILFQIFYSILFYFPYDRPSVRASASSVTYASCLVLTNQRAGFCERWAAMADTMKPSGLHTPANESRDMSSLTDCVCVLLKLLANFGQEVGWHCLNRVAPSDGSSSSASYMLMFLATGCVSRAANSNKLLRSAWTIHVTVTELDFVSAYR